MKIYFILLCIQSIVLLVSCTNNYYLTSYEYSDDGATFNGILTFIGNFNPKNYNYDWTNATSNLLTPIESLKIKISLECNNYLHIYVTDANDKRWEDPFSISDEYKQKVEECSKTAFLKSLSDFGLYINEDTEVPFYIKLINPINNKVIFNTENTDFLFTDVFIGFGVYITSNDVYGFGERVHNLKLGDGKFTMWPNDTSGIYNDTGEGGYNAMGIHPLGFHKTIYNSFIGLLFNNINAQDLVIKSLESQSEELNTLFEHRTLGGVIDYYITINGSPNEAIVSIHDIIGHPLLPPFWSLGFHQCRYGYLNTFEIRNVYKNYMGYEVPIDTFWGDIDILEKYRIFTLEIEHFKDLPNLISDMHSNNYKFVPIVDIGFPIADDDEFYRKGKELDSFIKSGYTDDDLISYVWPGKTVFPDFFTDAAVTLWEYGLERYYETVKYDGIWLDMNEPAMIDAEDKNRGELLPEGYDFDPKKNKYEYIPYIPGYRTDHPNIRTKTLSENAYSRLITQNKLLVSYNFKPLMAFMENRTTNKKLVELQKKRAFILSRSTSIGQGRYSFHWLGDNFATYFHMRNGLNGIFQFQIYGIPLTGDDICGFLNDSWDKLCARWMSLGAFFPFSRNHNTIGTRPQDPFAFGPNSLTLPSSRLALNMRYSLLRYYYTELFKISLGKSGAFFKPVFFEFYNDEKAYEKIDESAMLGNSLILYPVFSNETDDINVYLPNDDWNIYPTGEIFKNKSEGISGEDITLSGEYNHINIFMRGGRIIPYQETFEKYVPNTAALNEEPTELIINPDSISHGASGEVIFDDDSTDTLTTKNYYHIRLDFIHHTLYFQNNQSMNSSYLYKNIYLSKLTFFRMKYLNENANYNFIRIKYINGRIANVFVDKFNEDIIKVDLSKLKVKLNEISSIEFFENNPLA